MEIKKIFKFGFFQVIGTLIYTLGVAGLVVAGQGAGPIDAAAYFASVLFGLTQGSWTFILNFVLALVLLVALRHVKVLLNVLMLIVSGYLIDLWISIFQKVFDFNIKLTTITLNNGFMVGLLVAIFSFIVIAVGVSILIHFRVILSPLDEFTVFVARFTKKYFSAKILIDASFLAIALIFGFILGREEVVKQINFFSLVIVFGLGPFINLLLNLLKKGVKVEDGIEQIY